MIGDNFTVNDVQYEIKKDIKYGEYRKINQINTKLGSLSTKLGIDDDLTKIDPKDLQKIATEFATTNEEQMQIIADFLNSTIGLTQQALDDLTLNDAMKVFQETFKLATTPDKELKNTSDSLYS